MSNLMYVNPETLQEVEFNKLPKAYRENIGYNKPIEKYFEIKEEQLGENQIYKSKKQKALLETKDGKRLAVFLRDANNGGCVDSKGKLIFRKDERYDLKHSWKYPYGKQLVEIRKQKSHKFGENEWVSIYTDEYAVVHGAVKFEYCRQLANNMEDIRRRLKNGMLSKNEDDSLCATMCAMSDESPFRSGSKQVATRAKNKTHGITTLKVKHVSVVENEDGSEWLKIAFKGKGGELIKKVIKNPLTVVKVKALMRGKEPDDFLFTTKDGSLISPNELNAYCKKNGIHHFHLFRHIRASQRFKEAIDKILSDEKNVPDMPTSKEVYALVKRAAEESAKLLGNQAMTCINNYIAPQLMFDVFKRFDVPVADVIKKTGKLPDDVTDKDLKELMERKYFIEDVEEDDDDEIEADSSLYEEQNEVFAGIEDIPDNLFDDEKTTFAEDQEKRREFEDYLLKYEHDDSDIINDPELVTASRLVPVDFVPDFSELESNMNERGDMYSENKDTEYDCRDNSEVNKWGYNDYVGLTPKEMNKIWEDDAQRDIDNLLGDK